MNARLTVSILAAFFALATAANAQTSPQTPPNAGAAEAKPSTVSGPGGSTTLPANGSQAAPQPAGGDPDSGNAFTASPAAGPQDHLGMARNQTVRYIAVDYIAPPILYNNFAAGTRGLNFRNFAGRAAFEIPVGTFDVYVGGEARKYVYPTTPGPVTNIGSGGVLFYPSFTASQYDEDVRAGVKLIGPRIYAAVSGLRRGVSTGEYNERGIGYGIDKLADVDQNFALYGSVFYYPNVGGNYAVTGTSLGGNVSYRLVRFTAGIAISPKHSPLFLDAGFLGEYSGVRSGAPVGFRNQGPYVGLGIHF